MQSPLLLICITPACANNREIPALATVIGCKRAGPVESMARFFCYICTLMFIAMSPFYVILNTYYGRNLHNTNERIPRRCAHNYGSGHSSGCVVYGFGFLLILTFCFPVTLHFSLSDLSIVLFTNVYSLLACHIMCVYLCVLTILCNYVTSCLPALVSPGRPNYSVYVQYCCW